MCKYFFISSNVEAIVYVPLIFIYCMADKYKKFGIGTSRLTIATPRLAELGSRRLFDSPSRGVSDSLSRADSPIRRVVLITNISAMSKLKSERLKM
jgi:hypothetical protein